MQNKICVSRNGLLLKISVPDSALPQQLQLEFQLQDIQFLGFAVAIQNNRLQLTMSNHTRNDGKCDTVQS